LGFQEGETPSIPFPALHEEDQNICDFQTSIDKLNLPTRINATKVPLTSFSPVNKFHMVEHIDLNGFKDLVQIVNIYRDFQSSCLGSFFPA
jgi:hypothetical protein